MRWPGDLRRLGSRRPRPRRPRPDGAPRRTRRRRARPLECRPAGRSSTPIVDDERVDRAAEFTRWTRPRSATGGRACTVPLLAGATTVSPNLVRVARRGGLELHEHHPAEAVRRDAAAGCARRRTIHRARSRSPAMTSTPEPTRRRRGAVDARVVEVLPPDVRTMDLSEARRIVGGGAGLDSEERFAQLDAFAACIDGVMGATRVITDRGWVHHDRQIGTTGRRRRPHAVPVVRGQRSGAAHQRARCA